MERLGRYELIDEIGIGGMATVYRARQSTLNREVAVKVLADNQARVPEYLERFYREARIIAREIEDYTNVVQVYDLHEDGGKHFYAMELIPLSLAEHIGELTTDDEGTRVRRQKSQPLAIAAALGFLSQILKGLEVIHEAGIIHRDLCPRNVLLRESKQGLVAKISDFGISGMADSHLSKTGDAGYGKENYAAPEQLESLKLADARSDLYSVGMIAYRLVAGRLPPRRFKDPQEFNPKIPGWLNDWVLKNLEEEAQDRYQSAVEALAALAAPADEPVVKKPANSKVTPMAHEVLPIKGISNYVKVDRVQGKQEGSPKVGDEWCDPETGMTFVWIKAGRFMMGSDEFGDEKPIHEVILSQGFWLGKYPVIQQEWQQIMGANPSFFKGERLPVERVAWDDTQVFIKKLNGCGDAKFRLPTEAEWEYACRAGTTTPFSFGNTITTAQVNYNGNYPYKNGRKGEYREKTMPVGSLPANDWGLHEMHGNVHEWVNDWHGDYSSGSVTDPIGAGSGSYRVYRGGSWRSSAHYCRSADRIRREPGARRRDLGFRLARIP